MTTLSYGNVERGASRQSVPAVVGASSDGNPSAPAEPVSDKDSQIKRLQAQLSALTKEYKALAAAQDDRNREVAALVVMLEARDAVVARLIEQSKASAEGPIPGADTNGEAVQQPAGGNGEPKDNDGRSNPNLVEASAVDPAIQEENIIQLSKEIDTLRGEAEAARTELLAARKQIARMERDRGKAEADLQARFNEIASLTRRLEETSSQLEVARQERLKVEAPKAQAVAPKALPHRILDPQRLLGSWGQKFNAKEGRKRSKKALLAEIEAIRGSKAFDGSWYLDTYPDVALSGMDPAMHYLKFGAAEGRDPGPTFSTKKYVIEHPEVMEQQINPLIHFITTGRG